MLHIETQHSGSSSAIAAAFGSGATTPNQEQEGVPNIAYATGQHGVSGGSPTGLPLTSPTIPQHYSPQSSPNQPQQSNQQQSQQQQQQQLPQQHQQSQSQNSGQIPIPPHLKQPSPHSNSSASSPSSFSGAFSAAPEGSFGVSHSTQQQQQQQQPQQHHHHQHSTSPSPSFNQTEFDEKNLQQNSRSHSAMLQQQQPSLHLQHQQESADRYKAAAMMSFEAAATMANRGLASSQHPSALNENLIHESSGMMNGGGSSATDTQGNASTASPQDAGAKNFHQQHMAQQHFSQQHHHPHHHPLHHPPEPFANSSVGAVTAKTTPSMGGWPPFISPEKAPSEMLTSPPAYLNASSSRSSSVDVNSAAPESSYSTTTSFAATVVSSKNAVVPSASLSSSSLNAPDASISPLNPSSMSPSSIVPPLINQRSEKQIHQQEAFFNQMQQAQQNLQPQQQQQSPSSQLSPHFQNGGPKTVTTSSSSTSSASAFNNGLQQQKDPSSAYLSHMQQMAQQFLSRDAPTASAASAQEAMDAEQSTSKQRQGAHSPSQDSRLHPSHQSQSSPAHSPPLPPPPTHASTSLKTTMTTSDVVDKFQSGSSSKEQTLDAAHPPPNASLASSNRPVLKSLKDRIVTQMLEGRVTADEAVAAASGGEKSPSTLPQQPHQHLPGKVEERTPHHGGAGEPPIADPAALVRADFAAQMAAVQQQMMLHQQQQQQHMRQRQFSAGGGVMEDRVEPKREPMEEAARSSRSPSRESRDRQQQQQQQQQQNRGFRGERRPSSSESSNAAGSLPGSLAGSLAETAGGNFGSVARVDIDKNGKKIYICNICHHKDESKPNFHTHLATHYNERCSLCDYATTSLDRLKKHMQHFHPNKMGADSDEDEDDEAIIQGETSANLASKFGLPSHPPPEAMGPMSGDALMAPDSPGMDGGVSPSSGSGSDRLSSIPSLQALQAAAASQAGSEGEQEVDTFLEQASQITTTASGRPKVYRCKQCSFVGQTKISFWEHSRVHIKPEKLLACPKCPFVTEYKHHLEYHLRNHFGSKPFKCSKCNYSCVNLSMLRSHLRSHSNVYQYRCSDCTYATKYCHSLKLHLRKYNHKPASMLNSAGNPQPLPPDLASHIPGLPGTEGDSPPGFSGAPSPGLPCPSSPRAGSSGAFGNKNSPRKRLDMFPMPGGIPLPSPGEHPGAAAAAALWQHHMGMNPLLMNGPHPHMPPHPHLMKHDRPGEHPHPPLPPPLPPGRELQSRDQSHERLNSPMKGGEPDSGRFHPNGIPKSPTVGATGSPVAKCKLCDFAATSKDALGKHMLVHAAENNKDLVHLYGFSSESFTENGNPESAVPKSASGSEKRNAESSSSVPISTAHQLEVEKRRFALMQKLHSDGGNSGAVSGSSSVFGERNQTEVLSQVIAKYTENVSSHRAGGGGPSNGGPQGSGATKSPPTPGRDRRAAAEEAFAAARRNAFNSHPHHGPGAGGPPQHPIPTSSTALAAAAAVLQGGAAAAASGPPGAPQRHLGPPQFHDPKMMSPGGLLQLQQHLQHQLMIAAAAGIQPNPTLLAQAIQAQAAYAAAAAAHGRNMQPPEVPSPAFTRSPASEVDNKRGRSPSPENRRSPASRSSRNAANETASSPMRDACASASNGSGSGGERKIANNNGSRNGEENSRILDAGALDLSRGIENERETSPQSERSNSFSEGGSGRNSFSGSGSGQPNKKRPRKGPAFKLEQISARLQQRGSSDDEENGEIGSDEAEDMASEPKTPLSRPSSTPAAAAGRSGGGLNDLHDSLAELNNERGEQRWRGGKERRASGGAGNGSAGSRAGSNDPSADNSAAEVIVESPAGSPAWMDDDHHSPRNGRDESSSPSPAGGLCASPRVGGSGKRKSSIIKRFDSAKQQKNGSSASAGAEEGEHSGNGNGNSSSNHGNDDHNNGSARSSSSSPARSTTSPNAHSPNTTSPETVKKSDKKGDFFECPHCEIAFRDCVMYTMHMGYHGFDDPFHCNMCGDSLGDKVAFFLHIARVAHR